MGKNRQPPEDQASSKNLGRCKTLNSILGRNRSHAPNREHSPRSRYNQNFISRIQRALEEDSETDLSALLIAYDKERLNSLRCTKTTSPFPLSTERSPSPIPSPFPKLSSEYEIRFPLATEVEDLLHNPLCDSIELPSALHRVMQDSTIIHRGIVSQRLVLKIAANMVMKCVPTIDVSEIHSLEYLSSMAKDIPIPRLLGAICSNGWTYTFMSCIKGVTLESVWPRLHLFQKASIQAQLTEIFQQLRRVPISSGFLGSGEPPRCKDLRRNLRWSSDPIQSEKEFNEFLTSTTRSFNPVFLKLSTSGMCTTHKVVMAHGDLHPKNIMVEWVSSGDVTVTGIVDWELSGAYPEHWDYVKALNGVNCSLSDWYSYLPIDAIGWYPKEWMQDCFITRLIS